MANEPRDDIPAFPVTDNGGTNESHPGMSLRDWFAGMALAGRMAYPGTDPGLHPHGHTARHAEEAYLVADAMLDERAKRLAAAEGE